MSFFYSYRLRRIILPSYLYFVSARALTMSSQAVPYVPPRWSSPLRNVPVNGRIHLANLPTPLYRIHPSDHSENSIFNLLRELNIKFYVKRDDSSGGVELGGNKVRKLEFLLADALSKHCDSVITIGGEQSNHCRATAAASRMLGLEPHLILRTQRGANDIGLVGNLLVDRILGSCIYTCTPGEYGRIGSQELVDRLSHHLRFLGKNPYSIPVGGSNGLGSWGYINAVDELLTQWQTLFETGASPSLDHVVFACGSGGTAAGISLGLSLACGDNVPQIHAIGVCDDPDYFYAFVASIANEMDLQLPNDEGEVESFLRKKMMVHQGKGLGYAQNTPEELEFVCSFARETGIVLDPVYSGKALYNFLREVRNDPDSYRGKTILFWHTGGALGLYDKSNAIHEILQRTSSCTRLDVYGKGTGIDLSAPSFGGRAS